MKQVDSMQREARARDLRHEVVAQLTEGTHRTFRLLFTVQWVVALMLAWNSAQPDDSRVLFTALLGAVLSVPALCFAFAAPLAVWVRHFTAASQIGWSMTFVWLLEGRAEAHFHAFASLAFLAFYRDWRVLLTATLTAIAWPMIRVLSLPDSWLVSAAAWWRIVDQSVWVIAEFCILVIAVQQSLKTVQKFSEQAASLAISNESIGKDAHALTSDLAKSRDQYRLIAESTRAIPFELDLALGRFTYVGPQAAKVLGYPDSSWKETGFLERLLPRQREAAVRQKLDECVPGNFDVLCTVVDPDNHAHELHWTIACDLVDDVRVLRGFMIDVTDERRQSRESAHGQKLESVGRIAAGVAHEINTSVQFISDSVRFVRHALKDVPRALADYRSLAVGALSGKDVAEAARKATDTDEAADVDYFLKNAPEALDRALDGIGRVGSIVRSMTEFAHPDTLAMADVDINRAIRSTLNMARNEYKSVAELETDLADLPFVRCHAGDFNQVMLNLLLNAAHAIGDAVAGTSAKGRIRVRTRSIGDFVEVSITDTGKGIPESVRARIFEPFVTTKEVGRGTGQGLALSRGIVVDKLKGSLHFETETGTGTTFYVRLPISTPKQAAA